MEATERYTNSPTPPLPVRNPNHRYPYSYWNILHLDAYTSPELVVPPLFSSTTRPPSFAPHSSATHPTRPTSSRSSSSSITSTSSRVSSTSFTSLTSYTSTTTTTTTVSGPTPTCRPPSSQHQSFAFPPLDVYDWGNEWQPSHAQGRRGRLRRMKSPKEETLRDLRAKGSEVCLKRVCEVGVELYVNGGLGGVVEEDEEG